MPDKAYESRTCLRDIETTLNFLTNRKATLQSSLPVLNRDGLEGRSVCVCVTNLKSRCNFARNCT